MPMSTRGLPINTIFTDAGHRVEAAGFDLLAAAPRRGPQNRCTQGGAGGFLMWAYPLTTRLDRPNARAGDYLRL